MWPFTKTSATCAICEKRDFVDNLEYSESGVLHAADSWFVISRKGGGYYHDRCRKEAGGVQTCPRCNGKGECKIDKEEADDE